MRARYPVVDGDRDPLHIRVEDLVVPRHVGRPANGFLIIFQPVDYATLRLSRPDMRRRFAPGSSKHGRMTGKEAETGSGVAFRVPLQHLGCPERRKRLSEFEKREVR